MRSANFAPAAEALREPTTAIMGCASAAILPRTRDQRRRVVDHAQPDRVVRLAERDQRNAEPRRRGELALGLVAAAQPRGLLRAAAPRHVRQRLKGGTGAAEVIEQRAEGARPDILAADETQPVEPLRVGQTNPRCELVPPRTLPHETAEWRGSAGDDNRVIGPAQGFEVSNC